MEKADDQTAKTENHCHSVKPDCLENNFYKIISYRCQTNHTPRGEGKKKQADNKTSRTENPRHSAKPECLANISDEIIYFYSDVRPITPPEERERRNKQTTRQPERKIIVTGDTDLVLKYLFIYYRCQTHHTPRGEGKKKQADKTTRTENHRHW